MLRLTLGPLGLAALRGAAGESSFDYKLKGHRGGGLCAGASRSEESDVGLTRCRDRCSQDPGCKFLVFGEGAYPSCVLFDSCDKRVDDTRNYTAFQKIAKSKSKATTSAVDTSAIMLDRPIRNKDQPNDKKVNDLVASIGSMARRSQRRK
jgi:hypothetical protein